MATHDERPGTAHLQSTSCWPAARRQDGIRKLHLQRLPRPSSSRVSPQRRWACSSSAISSTCEQVCGHVCLICQIVHEHTGKHFFENDAEHSTMAPDSGSQACASSSPVPLQRRASSSPGGCEDVRAIFQADAVVRRANSLGRQRSKMKQRLFPNLKSRRTLCPRVAPRLRNTEARRGVWLLRRQ